jgi:manganese-dependent inorganic pyrophosphatase
MILRDKVVVIGHRNPDTDAIASAVGYAWLLNQIEPKQYVAARAGEVNPQTQIALDRFDVEAPLMVSDVRPRVADGIEVVPPLSIGQTVREACTSYAQTGRPVPLIDREGRPIGLLTATSIFGHLAPALVNPASDILVHQLDAPAEQALDAARPLQANDLVADVLGDVLRSEQDDFPVADGDGRYAGLARKTALLSPPRAQLILVDHNEVTQAIPGVEEADLIEVLDHHRVATLQTQMPIRFYADVVGSCSTLVLERAISAQIDFPPGIAGLLLCAVLSDTLVFRSPTTTDRDYTAARHLARMATLVSDRTETARVDEVVRALGEWLLIEGAGLQGRTADTILKTDLKYYEVNRRQAAIAQVEVNNFGEVTDSLAGLQAAVEALVRSQGLALAVLMVTDVVAGNSRLIAVGEQRVVQRLPFSRLPDGTLDAPQIVSRKKQLAPIVLGALTQGG